MRRMRIKRQSESNAAFFASAKTNRKRFDTGGAPEQREGYPTAGAIFILNGNENAKDED